MEKAEILSRVEGALDKIRPFLQSDGGDVKVVDLNDDGVLTVEFQGNCSACTMSNSTFKNGIEQTVLSDVKEIKCIEVTNLAAPMN